MIEKSPLYAEESLIPLPPYNWEKHMNILVPDNLGNQLFRLRIKNKNHEQNPKAQNLISKIFVLK
jgi:hypothetical protein